MMHVRAAGEEDVDDLSRIWHEGWHHAHARIVPAALSQLRTLASFRERLLADLPAIRVLETATPVGFAILRGDELYQFYISASARGSGAATVLMADAEAQFRARGVGVAWLACAVGNERAARFYEKCGWVQVGTIVIPTDTGDGSFPLRVWRYEKALSGASPRKC